MICSQIWVLLSQPLTNCQIWFIGQSPRASTPFFSSVFSLSGNLIFQLTFTLSWHWEGMSSPERSLVWVSHLTWHPIISLSPCLAHCSVASTWPLECLAGIHRFLYYLWPVMVLLPPIMIQSLSNPLVCLSFYIPAFLMGLRILSGFLCTTI